jgi:hypothetical protein
MYLRRCPVLKSNSVVMAGMALSDMRRRRGIVGLSIFNSS